MDSLPANPGQAASSTRKESVTNPQLAPANAVKPKSYKKLLISGSVFLIVLVFAIALLVFLEQRKAPEQAAIENYSLEKPEVISQRLEELTALEPEQGEAIVAGFIERDWPSADTERKKWSAYITVYSSLWARYNVTQDPAIRQEMKMIELFMAETWPDFYASAVEGESFLR